MRDYQVGSKKHPTDALLQVLGGDILSSHAEKES